MALTVAPDESEEVLGFEQALERLLDLIGKRLNVSIRAQGTTIFEEVMTATGTLVSGTDLPQWVREPHGHLLEHRLRFWLDSGSSFWLCRPEFLRATWWPANVEADTGRTLMVVLRGCELVIHEEPDRDSRTAGTAEG